MIGKWLLGVVMTLVIVLALGLPMSTSGVGESDTLTAADRSMELDTVQAASPGGKDSLLGRPAAVSGPVRWYELPMIKMLGQKARIIFFHVPTAWLSALGFALAMVYGIRYLRSKNLGDDARSAAAAGLGLLFCLLATVTGAIWAKFSWGTYWNWDPRQTSIFVLLLIYGAYFALRSAVEGDEKRAALSAVYSIIGAVTMPFFMFIMPRMLASLHPEPILNVQGKIHMNMTMLVVFLLSLGAFTGLFFWMWNLRVRVAQIESHSDDEGRA